MTKPNAKPTQGKRHRQKILRLDKRFISHQGKRLQKRQNRFRTVTAYPSLSMHNEPHTHTLGSEVQNSSK